MAPFLIIYRHFETVQRWNGNFRWWNARQTGCRSLFQLNLLIKSSNMTQSQPTDQDVKNLSAIFSRKVAVAQKLHKTKILLKTDNSI